MRRLINFKSMDFIGYLNTNLLVKFMYLDFISRQHIAVVQMTNLLILQNLEILKEIIATAMLTPITSSKEFLIQVINGDMLTMILHYLN